MTRSSAAPRSSFPPAEPKVAGAILLDQVGVLRMQFPDAFARALTRMDAGERDAVMQIGAVGWYPVAFAKRLKDAVAVEAGIDSIEMQKRVVRASMERVLKGIWRIFLRLISDEGLIKRTPIFYSKTFDRGSMVATWVGARELSAEVRGWRGMPDYDIVGLATGIEVLFDILGRKVPLVEWKRAPDGASFRIRLAD